MITRSFNGNQFAITDWTEELLVIPNQWGTIGSLGLFQEESVAEHTVTFEETTKDGALLVDRVRGERGTVGKDYGSKLHTFAVPHFPHEDAIYPKDVQGKRAYGTPDSADTLALVRTRKMERIAQNFAWTLEYARAQAITLGTVYAPSGTVVQNWNTEFGVTRKTVDFVFGTGTTEIGAKIEEALAHIQDNTGTGGVLTGIICLCSPEWFAKLISHATVKAAYQYYASTQEPLRNRLAAGNSPTAVRREFFYMGVQFIEMRDTFGGTIGAGTGSRLLPAGKAYFVPQGTDCFKTYYSPAERFEFVNTLGERMYMFENMAQDGTKYEIHAESNFVNCVMRPNTIVEAFTSN